MICFGREMDEVEALVLEVKEELKAAGIPFKEIRTGIMMGDSGSSDDRGRAGETWTFRNRNQ